jgi:integrase/recombinase XerC
VYQQEQYLMECGGVFLPIVREYLEGFAVMHYSEQQTLRHHLLPFFEYLNHAGILSLEDVMSKTVTAFLEWARKDERRSLADNPSFISTFFKWAIASGYRDGGNPRCTAYAPHT